VVNPASLEFVPGPESGTPAEPAGATGAGPTAAASGPAGAPPAAGPVAVPWWAWAVLALVVAMHVLRASDIWLMARVLPYLGVDSALGLEEAQTGWLATALLVGAAIAGPAVGYLCDRSRRGRLLAIGFAAWSLAVVATGLARSYVQILAARAAGGAGGAAATVIALTLLADAFPRRMRGRAFAALFLAMPAGMVLGLVLAVLAPHFAGWQAALLAVGAPGLVLAMLALLVPEPVRGAGEPVDEARLRLHEQLGPSREDYIDLMVNSSFTYSVFGMAFSSFALAGLLHWLPAFLEARWPGPAWAGPRPLLILSGAAAGGTIAGGWLADAFAATRPSRLFFVPGLAMLAAIGGLLAAVYGRSPIAIESGLFLAVAAMSLVVAPGFTILAGVTMPSMRGVGFGVALAAGHFFGDIWSPTLMGWAIHTFAQPDSMATGFGRFLAAIGATPIVRPDHDPENLTAGLLVLVPALLIAAAVLLAGVRHLPRELALMIAKLRAAPSRRR
jgi:MFS transporter, Spinster family, sphingosine-1-phosphate transporter